MVKRALSTAVLFGLLACTSVRVEQEQLPALIVDPAHYAAVDTESLKALRLSKADKLVPGVVLIVLKTENPSERTENTPVLFKSFVQEAWPTVLKEIEQIPLFGRQKVLMAWDDRFDATNTETYFTMARKDGARYVLFLSCRQHLSVPTSVFHQALKASTFNLYDLFPVFKYNLGSFHVNYTASWDGALFAVSRRSLIAQASSIATAKAFDRGEDPVLGGDDDYKKTAVVHSGQLFVRRLSLRLEGKAD